MNADQPTVQSQLGNLSVNLYKQIFGKAKVVYIDEAQRIKNIGLVLKLIVDEIPEVQIVSTGSSAFEQTNSVNEPLTGRKFEYKLFPISWAELVSYYNYIDAMSQLNQRIVFGMYPEVITHIGEEKETLLSLTESYLYKDIIAFQQIRKPVELRNDIGALWENFVIAEKIKANHYKRNFYKYFFWRTHQKQEIDFIEEADVFLKAYEIKWNPKAKFKIPKSFVEAYPKSTTEVINPLNFYKFIL